MLFLGLLFTVIGSVLIAVSIHYDLPVAAMVEDAVTSLTVSLREMHRACEVAAPRLMQVQASLQHSLAQAGGDIAATVGPHCEWAQAQTHTVLHDHVLPVLREVWVQLQAWGLGIRVTLEQGYAQATEALNGIGK